MEKEKENQMPAELAEPDKLALPIGPEQLREANRILDKYKSGKQSVEDHAIWCKEYWRLRYQRYKDDKDKNKRGTLTTTSAWLFNTVMNKHADGMASYPMPNILPRQEDDKQEAQNLSDIVPIVLQQNDFEDTYSECLYDKLIEGSGFYGIFWDPSKLNGLGDIDIRRVSVLNLFWEPGLTDLQESQHLFHTELVPNEVLRERYPQLKDVALDNSFMVSTYLTDDSVDNTDKSVVVDWYYHKHINGKRTLQYCKYVGETVIYATENETQRPMGPAIDEITGKPFIDPQGNPIQRPIGESIAERGWYDHGMYPFEKDTQFPNETMTGFGYVDVCKSPQEAVDLMDSAVVTSALMHAKPRAICRRDSGVNIEEFRDWTKDIIHADGQLTDDAFRWIQPPQMDDLVIAAQNNKIQEMRETSGNTETAAGSVQAGVTAASAIAALQEASGKSSKDSIKASWRTYKRIIYQVIELIRQFYDVPRQFRILGQNGRERFVSYDNTGLKPRPQGTDFGVDMGYRLPVFDIEVDAESMSTYSRVAQNELAKELMALGVFNPENTDQSLLLLDIMDFPHKEELAQKVAQNGTLLDKMLQYQQLAMLLAARYEPQVYAQLAQEAQMTGAPVPMNIIPEGQSPGITATTEPEESTITKNARERSEAASQPQ